MYRQNYGGITNSTGHGILIGNTMIEVITHASINFTEERNQSKAFKTKNNNGEKILSVICTWYDTVVGLFSFSHTGYYYM